MDLMSLVAKLTLDSSDYLKGLEEAKKAAEEIGAEIKKTTEKASKQNRGSGGSGRRGGKPKEAAKNTDPTETFLKYLVDNNEKITSVTTAIETAARAFADASKGTSAEGIGKFVEYLADHKDELTEPAGALTSFAGALGQALQTTDDPMATGVGKFLEYMVDNKENLDNAAGIITTLAGALGESLKGSDNEGVALAGDFLSYMAQNAANLTNPVGVVMTLLVYLVENWATISAFFSSVAPAWLLELPASLSEAWTGVMNAINDAITALQNFFATRAKGGVDANGNPNSANTYGLHSSGNIDDILASYEAWNNQAAGLDYVPRNGYRSILHEGEAVLNKRDAETWRKGGEKLDISAKEVADAFVAALDGAFLTMDGVKVGKLVTKTVSREMERDARNNRFTATGSL